MVYFSTYIELQMLGKVLFKFLFWKNWPGRSQVKERNFHKGKNKFEVGIWIQPELGYNINSMPFNFVEEKKVLQNTFIIMFLKV